MPPNILVIWGDDIGITNLTFQEFPPRQKAASFTIDQVVA
jgi:arylsulfatase A-like enzyme